MAWIGSARLTEMTDEELLEIACSEAEGGVEGPQTKQDLEVIAILSAVNTGNSDGSGFLVYHWPVKVRCNIGTQDDVSN